MFWRQHLSWSRHFHALFMIGSLDESVFIDRAFLIAHEHRSPLTPDTGHVSSPAKAAGRGHSSVWGRGQGSGARAQPHGGPEGCSCPCLGAQLTQDPAQGGWRHLQGSGETNIPSPPFIQSGLLQANLTSRCPPGPLGRERPAPGDINPAVPKEVW